MRTDKQNEASKINGAKSKGPTSEEGKANSSRNAARHGLSGGHIVLLHNEDRALLNAITQSYCDRFQPIDEVEFDLVHQMVAATWRIRRISAMESAILDLEIHTQRPKIEEEFDEIQEYARTAFAFRTLSDTTPSLAVLGRYEVRARRAYNSALRNLQTLQGDRFNRQPEAVRPPQPQLQPDAETPAARREAPTTPAMPPAQMLAFVKKTVKNTGLPNEPEQALDSPDFQALAHTLAAGWTFRE